MEYVVRNSQGFGVAFPILLRHYARLLGEDISDYKTKKRLEMRLRRLITKLSKEKYLIIEKVDGLLWVRPNPAKVVDLIHGARVTQTRERVPCVSNAERYFPSRAHPARRAAARFLSSRHILREEDWRQLHSYLENYREDVESRVIVLGREVEGGTEYIFLHYKHRFSRSGLKRVLERYEAVWKNVRANYGVFITLTMDPKTYGSLYEASRKLSKAFNRFMSFLAKRLGFRPQYVSVLEPQDSGNPHLHVVIFGVSRIAGHFELTPILKNQGFGRIHFEYKIERRGDSWVWARGSPSGASVKDYLKKYLKKVFYEDEIRETCKLAFYFASNKRFFTCSRSILPRVVVKLWSEWFYVGSWCILDLPDWVNQYVLIRSDTYTPCIRCV